ncbi:MAG: hypothetical protein WAN08_20875 [Candidatus Sulfotelmatobacter sp.]
MRPVLEHLSPSDVHDQINGFPRRYVQDWKNWLEVSTCFDAGPTPVSISVAQKFGEILWNWRACGRFQHPLDAMELFETLKKALPFLDALGDSNLRTFHFPTDSLRELIRSLWTVFYDGLCMKGTAGHVAITKAILLITRGRIGPAFDSNVKRALGIRYLPNSESLVSFLSSLAKQLLVFEDQYAVRIESLVPIDRGPVAVGRAVDMLLGPKERH